MKKIILGCLFLGTGLLVNAEEVVIYGPSSMKWIGKKYGSIFEEKTGDTIKFVSIDGVVGRLTLEKKNPKADVVVGMTELTTEMAKRDELIVPYVPKNIGKIAKEEYKMYSDYVVPIDYGYLAINYNKQEIKNPPKNIAELGKMTKKLLVENPNLSNTGQEALQWSIALYGDDWMKFWKELKPAIYSTESGWTEAFAKFTAGEAPMMIGYATSNLFFTGEDAAKYDSFLLEDGTFMYQEGASLVNKKEIKPAAKKFMEEILSDEFQELVVKKNYMFPVISIALTEDFTRVPVPEKSVKMTKEQIDKAISTIDNDKKELVEFLKK
ncbi:thiamine ABC transporter substrate-binding protein [Fusobacterium sp.]|uniref:thiamine ABC transporter substrate-binding protein n=1 Tax=Fusobacterium sp. TaxID=68766 RepID=UPI00396CE7AD